MLPPLLPCYSLDYLGRQLLNQPFIFYIFFAFHPSLPRFPHGVYNYFAVSCAFSPLFHPPRSYPPSCSRYPRPRSHLRYCPRFRPRFRSRSHPVFVYGSPPPSPFPSPFPSCAPSFTSTPVPVLRSFVHIHPRSRSRSVPIPMTVHVPVTVSVPAPDTKPTSDCVYMYVCMYRYTYSKGMDQPGKVANPARGQLNREK